MALQLLDMVPLEDLQRLQDSFAEITNMGAVISDLNGQPITTPSNFYHFCAMMRSRPSTMRNCVESDRLLGQMAHTAGRVAFRPCSNLKLLNAAAPIVLNGEHIADWLYGPLKFEPTTEEEIAAFAQLHGHDPAELSAAYNNLPKVGNDYFERTVKLLALFSETLSIMCGKNYRLTESDRSRELAILSLETMLDNADVFIQIIDPLS